MHRVNGGNEVSAVGDRGSECRGGTDGGTRLSNSSPIGEWSESPAIGPRKRLQKKGSKRVGSRRQRPTPNLMYQLSAARSDNSAAFSSHKYWLTGCLLPSNETERWEDSDECRDLGHGTEYPDGSPG